MFMCILAEAYFSSKPAAKSSILIKIEFMISPLPWLTERLYRLRTGVPLNMLLGVRTEGDSECGVRGVDGAVAL